MAEKIGQQAESLRVTSLCLGPLTEAYQGDVNHLIEKLNTLRSTELVSYLQYKEHAYMAVSMFMPAVKAEFEAHAAVEQRHSDMLADRISQLGGTPVFKPGDFARLAASKEVVPDTAPTLEEMIVQDLEDERRQIVAYTRLIREVAFDDPTTRRMLEDILKETEEHASELRDMISAKSR